MEEKSEREETREERGVSIKGKHGGVVLFCNRRCNCFYVKFGGNLGSVIEKIENENSVCVVKSLWRT